MRLFTMVALLSWVIIEHAHAFPDGAPWGAAKAGASGSCQSCHFDQAPDLQSESIHLEGLAEDILPGKTYALTLRFDAGAAVTAGFMMRASTGDFRSVDPMTQVSGSQIRSTAAAALSSQDGAVWRFLWEAPRSTPADRIIFDIAVNGANDDQSALGDQIHLKSEIRKILSAQ